MAANELRWKPKQQRGQNSGNVVDYILLAEFDIDSGSTLRHQYPLEIPDYKPDWFAEHMLPEGAHNRETDYTYIFLNRNSSRADGSDWSDVSPDGKALSSTKHFLYGLNFVKTKHDATVRRGAILKALCIFSRYSFIEAFKKPLELALEEYFNNPSVSVLKVLYESLNSISLSALPNPTPLEQLLMRRGVSYDSLRKVPNDYLPSSWNKSISGQFQDYRLYLSIPVYRTPDEVGDISVSNLVRVFGEAVMRIFHAVLTKQRVLFVGYNHAASDIAQMVLSSVALVSPPMSGIIRRTFPYSTLSDLGFTEVPGYIAGVTNPMFQQHEAWWDLLCVLDLPNNTGFIYSAEERRNEDTKASGSTGTPGTAFALPPSSSKLNLSAAEEMPHYVSDAKFIQGVISAVQARIGEDWVRQQFYDYAVTIINHTQDKKALLNGAKLQEKTKKFLESNLQRMNALDQVAEFRSLPKHNWVWMNHSSNNEAQKGEESDESLSSVDGLLLKTYVRKLLNETGLDNRTEVVEYYRHFLNHLSSESSLQVFLTMLPDSQGGLVYFAAGLFHSSPFVRYATAMILQRINSFPSTASAFETMNSFFLLAYERQLQKIESGELTAEMKAEEESLKNPVVEEPEVPSAAPPAHNNFDEFTSVLSSATGITGLTHVVDETSTAITHVVDETSTVLSSLLHSTLEFMSHPTGNHSSPPTKQGDATAENLDNSSHSDDSNNGSNTISPIDMMA